MEIPIASIEDVVDRIGPHDLDITGSAVKADGFPQGPFEKIEGCPAGSAYPCLWNHRAPRERSLLVEPDSHCRVRQVGGAVPPSLAARAATRWQTASRVHYNRDLQFNAQSTIVAFTDSLSLGGRAWPTVLFEDEDDQFAFALWCNSTLGLVCHWWMSNKTQAGRSTSTITSIPTFPTLDFRGFTEKQRAAARSAFDEVQGERLVPFDQVDEDEARGAIDTLLLEDVLGLPKTLCAAGGPMERLRTKLAREPQIRGRKKTRLMFTPEGERNMPR